MTELVTMRSEGRVAVLTLNRPERRNAISPELREALGAALERAEADPGCGAVVIRGEGGVFCGGGDVAGMGGLDLAAAQERMAAVARVARRLIAGPVPVVACVEGPAYGAGLAIAAAACHVVAAPDARFCAPFSNLGLTVDWGLTWTLPRRVGHARAKRMCMLAEALDAEAALAAGLADEIAPRGAALERALAVAGRFAARAPLAMARTRLAFAAAPADPDAALALEGGLQAELMQTADHGEGVAAFLEKRSPVFVGG